MLFAIRNQLTIFVVMAVFSTGLTLGLSCVYIYIYTYTQKCTYTHEGESDSKSDVIIYCREKGVPHTICWGKKNQCWYHPLKSKGHHLGSTTVNTAGFVALNGIVLCNLILT